MLIFQKQSLALDNDQSWSHRESKFYDVDITSSTGGWGMGTAWGTFSNLLPFPLKSLFTKTSEQTAYHLDNHTVIIKSHHEPALLCLWASFCDPTLTMNSPNRIYWMQNNYSLFCSVSPYSLYSASSLLFLLFPKADFLWYPWMGFIWAVCFAVLELQDILHSIHCSYSSIIPIFILAFQSHCSPKVSESLFFVSLTLFVVCPADSGSFQHATVTTGFFITASLCCPPVYPHPLG